jgi:hypothetical protein
MVVVQGTKPAQVVVQIVGGDAVKAIEPLFESAMIGIDVLDMDSAVDAQACAEVDGIMRNARFLRKVAVGRIAFRSPAAHPWPGQAATRRSVGFCSSVRLP